MPSWTQKKQEEAEKQMLAFQTEYKETHDAWINGIQSGNPAQYRAATEDVLRRWRASINDLRSQSDSFYDNHDTLDMLNQLVVGVQDERALLKKLKSEAVTREDQAYSVNPKVRDSPYINLLWLDRTFRPSTRAGIIAATSIFGVIALGATGFMGYRLSTSGLPSSFS
jgi:hypothetical protein